MICVRNIVRKKVQRNLPTIDPGVTVLDALKELSKLDVGALLVIKNEKILGIFSERDYARKIVLEGRQSPSTLVQHVMTRNVLYVGLDNTIEECIFIMVEKRIRHLPVISNSELIDFLSIKDVIESIVDEKEFLINQLTQYITGSRSNQNQFLPTNLISEENLIQMNRMSL